jgi:cobalt-zinc-cadmium efflux system membrane fusion protein
MSERVKRMVELRAASQNDLLVAESELAEAELAVTSARTRLASLNIRVADAGGYWVIAQREGIVVQLDAAVGKEVGPDKDRPVATVADIDEVQVLADLPPHEAGHVAVGDLADIREAGDQKVVAIGKVEMVSQVLDQERQTIPVRIRVKNNPPVLRPHAFVEVILVPRKGQTTVVVPAEAIVSDGARSAVFAELRAGSYQRRYVRLGNRTREQVEVLSGLDAGSRIVTRGAVLLLSALTTGQ